MSNLFEICACEEDLKVLKKMEVVSVSDYTDNQENSGVVIEFIGPTGQTLTLSIADGAELHRSPSLQPLYCAQDLREYIGYTITRVESDEDDLDSKVYLENPSGNTVVLHTDRALDGETLFIEE